MLQLVCTEWIKLTIKEYSVYWRTRSKSYWMWMERRHLQNTSRTHYTYRFSLQLRTSTFISWINKSSLRSRSLKCIVSLSELYELEFFSLRMNEQKLYICTAERTAEQFVVCSFVRLFVNFFLIYSFVSL